MKPLLGYFIAIFLPYLVSYTESLISSDTCQRKLHYRNLSHHTYLANAELRNQVRFFLLILFVFGTDSRRSINISSSYLPATQLREEPSALKRVPPERTGLYSNLDKRLVRIYVSVAEGSYDNHSRSVTPHIRPPSALRQQQLHLLVTMASKAKSAISTSTATTTATPSIGRAIFLQLETEQGSNRSVATTTSKKDCVS